MKVIHIITGLSTGGAETMLYKLLSRTAVAEYTPEVISLTDDGQIAGMIRDLGVPVHTLEMKRGKFNPLAMIRLTRLLRTLKPDLVQTWMYHSDLMGGIAAKLAGVPRLIWNIRQSNIDIKSNKRSTVILAKICARLSGYVPDQIICCSHAALRSHAELGYVRKRMLVIPNGFDYEKFHPESNSRVSVRNELGLDKNTMLVGLLARFDKQKDHLNLIKAASLVTSVDSPVHYLLCGDGISWNNKTLAAWLIERGLEKRFHLLGLRKDVNRLLTSLDLYVSSSLGEGFPNAVGEAMSCAIPCIVTDVGDSALLVGDTGSIVPAEDPGALAFAIGKTLNLGSEHRKESGLRARQRIIDCFSIENAARLYEKVYRDAVSA